MPKRKSAAKEELFLLLRWQDYKCAICGRNILKKPYWDHDHNMGKLRGLLCARCNIALGFYETWFLPHRKKIRAYLRFYGSRTDR